MIAAGWRLVLAAIEFAAGEGHPHRAAGREGGEAEQRLDAEVELGAEAAADRRGQDADALGRQAEQRGGVVAVHPGRLGAGADDDGVAVEPGGAGLGLDIGVLDEAGADLPGDDVGGGGQRCARRRRGGPGPRSAGCRRGRGGRGERRAPRRRPGRPSAGSGSQATGKSARSAGPPSSKATSATASPRKRASASASAGWSAKRGITPKRLRPGMSAAVRTAATSGRAAAQAARSPKRKPARGCGERTAFRTRPPGCQRSAPNASLPSTLAGPSSRRRRAPTAPPAGGGVGGAHRACRRRARRR